jgi:redox-sensitive bicupin YhaK (pirin superfamily)
LQFVTSCLSLYSDVGFTIESELVQFDRGGETYARGRTRGVRFLLVSGKPLEEPIAWHGLIVNDTQQRLQTCFEEFDRRTFLEE